MNPTPPQPPDTTPPREPTSDPITPEDLIQGWWNNHTNPTQPPTGNHTPPLTLIYWWDALSYGTNNWTDHTDTQHPAPTLTIGWITETTPTHITIIPLTNTNHWGNGITIPTGTIHHTTTLPPPT